MPKFNIEEASQVALQSSCMYKHVNTIIFNGDKKMKTITISTVVALTLAFNASASELPIQNGTYSDENHLVIMADRSGLNNYKCASLFNSNKTAMEHILDRRSIKKMKLTHLSLYVFDEQITKVAEVKSKKKGTFRRDADESKGKLLSALYEDNDNKAKDSMAVIDYLNLIASNSTNLVVGVIFSNMRNSTMTKDDMKAMSKIKLNPNLKIITYSKSGLSCLKGGATASQIIKAEQSYGAWYKSKIDGSFEFKTIY